MFASGRRPSCQWSFPSTAPMVQASSVYLPNMVATADGADANLTSHVAELRRRDISWTKIGDALGVVRQSASERSAHRLLALDRS